MRRDNDKKTITFNMTRLESTTFNSKPINIVVVGQCIITYE